MQQAQTRSITTQSLTELQWQRIFEIHDRALSTEQPAHSEQMQPFLEKFQNILLLETDTNHLCGYVFYGWHSSSVGPVLEVEWMMIDPDCRPHASSIAFPEFFVVDALANDYDTCYTVVLLSEKGLRRVLQWCAKAEYFGQTDSEQPLQQVGRQVLPVISRGRFNQDGRHSLGFGVSQCEENHDDEYDEEVCRLCKEADGRVWIIKWSIDDLISRAAN